MHLSGGCPCHASFCHPACDSSHHLVTGAPSWYISREGPLPRLPTPLTPTPPPYVSSGIPLAVHSQMRNLCHATHPSASTHHLRPTSPNGRRWYIAREAPLPRLLISTMQTTPPAESYLCTRWGISREGPLPRLPTTAMPTLPPYVSSGIPKAVYSQMRNLCHATHPSASPHHLRSTSPNRRLGTSPRRAPCDDFLYRQCRRRLRPNPTGAPKWGISREGPLPRLPNPRTPTLPPYVSSGIPKAVHSQMRNLCHATHPSA